MKKILAMLLVFSLLIGCMVVMGGCSKEDDKEDEQQQAGTDTEDQGEDKDQDQSEDTQNKDDEESDTLVLGTSADYPPYEFHKLVDGKDTIIGFDIAIAEEIAKDYGKELQIRDMGFDGLLAALDEGMVDFVIAGMTPTEERKEQVDFSDIYYTATQGILVRADDFDSVKSFEDLNGKKVGVQTGTIQEGIANEKIEDPDLLSIGKITDLVLALKNETVFAIVMELPVAKAYESKNDDLKVADYEYKDETGGSAVAVKKGNEKLLESIQSTLKRLKESGKIDEFVTEASEANETEE